MTQERPEEDEEDQEPTPQPVITEEAGHGRRTFGLGLFFLASSIGALVVWWLALYSPVALDQLFGHYEGIESATEKCRLRLHSHSNTVLCTRRDSSPCGLRGEPKESQLARRLATLFSATPAHQRASS